MARLLGHNGEDMLILSYTPESYTKTSSSSLYKLLVGCLNTYVWPRYNFNHLLLQLCSHPSKEFLYLFA